MFTLVTKEGSTLKTIVELFQASFSQIVFKINARGMFCRMPNVQGTMLFDLVLSPDHFNEFVLGEDELFFGVNISHLYKIISSVKKKDTIHLHIARDCPDKMSITIVPREMDYQDGGFVFIEKVQNIDIDVPRGYEGAIHAPHGKFSKMWKELSSVSKEVRIEGNAKRVEFQAVVDGILGRKTEYASAGAPAAPVFKGAFQIEELIKLNKLAGFGSPIYFSVKEGLPLKIRVNAGTLGTLHVYVCKN